MSPCFLLHLVEEMLKCQHAPSQIKKNTCQNHLTPFDEQPKWFRSAAAKGLFVIPDSASDK